MDIRQARPDDRPAVRDVARRSMQASYSLDPATIAGAIDEWYDGSRLKAALADDDKLLLVAERDGQVVAFSDSSFTGESTGEIFWIHVDPGYRDEDIGARLFEVTRERLADRGATHFRGRVLADNAAGNAFYERHGLVKVGEETVRIDGTPYVENVYAAFDEGGIEPIEGESGTVYVNHDSTETGSIAPFHVVYTERDGEDIYGYWCSQCETFANAMDPMGRIKCDTCGNARKPTRWDAAYL